MKSKTCKRVVAVAMAVMLAITAVPAPDVQAAAKPKLSTTKKTMTEGQKLTLTVKNKPAKATLTWKTSNKKVATVTQKGVVKAVKKGKAVITVTVKTKTKKYNLKSNITVKSKASQPTTPSTPSTTDQWALKYVDAGNYQNILADFAKAPGYAGTGKQQPELTAFADNFSLTRDTNETLVNEYFYDAAGSLNYVKGYTAFSSEPEMQEGYYIHTMVEIPAEINTTSGVFKITVDGKEYAGDEALTTVNGKKYFYLVKRVNKPTNNKDDHYNFSITWGTGGNETEYYNINFANVTFNEPAQQN